MKKLLPMILILGLLFSMPLCARASIFDPAQQTQEQIDAEEAAKIAAQNARLKEHINTLHTFIFNAIWNNPRSTPQGIFDQFKGSTKELFEFSADLQELLCKANGGLVQDGLCVDGEYSTLVPGYSYTLNDDGTVTVVEKIATEDQVEEPVE